MKDVENHLAFLHVQHVDNELNMKPAKKTKRVKGGLPTAAPTNVKKFFNPNNMFL